MKLAAAFLLVLLAGLFFILPDQNDNLLVNGDFETVKNGNMPDNWNGDNKVYSVSRDAASGNYSLKYFNNNPTVYKLCTQQINLEPGGNYTAGVKIKTSDIAGEDYGASFCVEWFDANGNWIGGAFPKGLKGTNDWSDISTVVSVPDSAKKFIFCCYVRKGMTGTAWFDDAYIKPYNAGPMKVVMLKPLYRGILFSDSEQKIILSVNLVSSDLNTMGHFSSSIADSSGKELISSFTGINSSKTNYNLNLDASGIMDGRYTAAVKLFSKSGELLASWEKPLTKISRENQPHVYFDDQQRLIVNNKKVFPLGMYWGSINENDLKNYSESNFNFILPYSRPTEEQMRLAEKYHIKVIYSVKDLYASTQYAPAEIKSTNDEIVMLDQTIQTFKDSPAFLAWYNNDEFRPEFMHRLEEHYNILKNSDYNHPVLSIIIDPNQSDLYLNSTDIIGSDPYVIPNQKLSLVGQAVVDIEEKIRFSQPIWMVIQAHNIGNYTEFIPNPRDYRTPTYDEMRCMSWQAICKGANGLIYYSYFDLKRNPDVSFETQWLNLKKIVSEIDTCSAILLSEDKADSVEVTGTDGNISWLDWTTREYNNKLYIFAVDNGIDKGEVEFILPVKYRTLKQIRGINKIISVGNSRFKDTFRNLEVKIYEAE